MDMMAKFKQLKYYMEKSKKLEAKVDALELLAKMKPLPIADCGGCIKLQVKVDELTKAITDFREGNYSDPRSYRPNDCPHGAHYWQECPDCDEEHWQAALKKEVEDE